MLFKLSVFIYTVFIRLSAVFTCKQGCGVWSPVIRLRFLEISIIRLRFQLRLRADSDLQLY